MKLVWIWGWAALLVVAGCGAGPAACGSCHSWEFCNGGTCQVSATSQWDVWAQTGKVTGRDAQGTCWVPACTAPATYVCVSLLGSRHCSVARNGNAPDWEDKLYTSVTGDTLRMGFTVEYLAKVPGEMNDPTVCKANLALSDDFFDLQRFDMVCGANGDTQASFGLIPGHG